MKPESRKSSNLPPSLTSLLTTFLIIQPRCEVSCYPSIPPWQSTSSTCITIFLKQNFYEITSAFLKTGINLRNLPSAHSRGAVTFSGLCVKCNNKYCNRQLRHESKSIMISISIRELKLMGHLLPTKDFSWCSTKISSGSPALQLLHI